MEATAVSQSTGSKTIADLLPLAAGKYGDQVAVRHKVAGEWRDVSYSQLGEIVFHALSFDALRRAGFYPIAD